MNAPQTNAKAPVDVKSVPMTREQWEAHKRSRGSYFVSYQDYLNAALARIGGAS